MRARLDNLGVTIRLFRVLSPGLFEISARRLETRQPHCRGANGSGFRVVGLQGFVLCADSEPASETAGSACAGPAELHRFHRSAPLHAAAEVSGLVFTADSSRAGHGWRQRSGWAHGRVSDGWPARWRGWPQRRIYGRPALHAGRPWVWGRHGQSAGAHGC